MRRRWPRFEVGGTLTAQIAVLDLVMPVRDISVGGFAVEAPLRFAQGEIHELTLTLASEQPARVRARAAYCYAKRDREHLFMTGWEALGDPDTARTMAGLVDRFLALKATATAAVAEDQPRAYHGTPPTHGSPRVPLGTRGV